MAIEAALDSRGFIAQRSTFADGALLDAFFRMRVVNEAMDKDAGRVNRVGIELAGLDDDFGFGNGDLAAGGDHGVEIARH